MAKPIQTCGIEGVITDPLRIADWLMANYFTARQSASTLHPGETYSIALRYKEYSTDPAQLIRAIRNDIQNLLRNHLDEAEIAITRQTIEEGGSEGVLIIKGTITDSGYSYQLSESTWTKDGYLRKVLDR